MPETYCPKCKSNFPVDGPGPILCPQCGWEDKHPSPEIQVYQYDELIAELQRTPVAELSHKSAKLELTMLYLWHQRNIKSPKGVARYEELCKRVAPAPQQDCIVSSETIPIHRPSK